MKISQPIPKKTSSKNGFIPPPIPLERPEPKILEKGTYLAMKLRSIPDNDESLVYELQIPYFKTGTPEEWFQFVWNLKRVLVGQHLTQGPNQYAMTPKLSVAVT